MEKTNQELYNERVNRIRAAVSHTEGDRVPICVQSNTFTATYGGYTQAEVNYDINKLQSSLLKYATQLKPDNAWVTTGGMGPILDTIMDNTQLWAGASHAKVDDNSMTQFLEFPLMLEEEFDYARSDTTGWLLHDCFPRIAQINEPFKKLNVNLMMANSNLVTASLAKFFADPEVIEMIEKYQKVARLLQEQAVRSKQIEAALEQAGFPTLIRGNMLMPWDHYTDYYRGTEEGLMDIYANPEQIQWHFQQYMPVALKMIQVYGKTLPAGSFVFMPLHKGDVTFISDAHYQELYWPYLYKIVTAILEQGLTPYLFCEGNYENRLKYLKQFPKGVYCRFEKMDMALAKKEIGDQVCIGGGFPNRLLEYGTRQQVVDACKQMIDVCAPGGGFIFETAYNLVSDSKIENVEAMFETVHTYGKY